MKGEGEGSAYICLSGTTEKIAFDRLPNMKTNYVKCICVEIYIFLLEVKHTMQYIDDAILTFFFLNLGRVIIMPTHQKYIFQIILMYKIICSASAST